MAKVKKFDVLAVPVEAEYERPILGRFFGALSWLMAVRVTKFRVTTDGGRPLFSFYRLVVPRFLKGGASGGEQ